MGGELAGLPEDCLAHALALTTPRDACRLAAVCAAFRSAAASEILWDRFLRANFSCAADALARRAASMPPPRSKKELYLHLSGQLRPFLPVDGDTVRAIIPFNLHRETLSGAKHCKLSSRALAFVHGDYPGWWSWAADPDSTFPAVAKLTRAWWLCIEGKLKTRALTKRTRYTVFFVYKVAEPPHSYGLEHCRFTARVASSAGVASVRDVVMLHEAGADHHQATGRENSSGTAVSLPRERGDGWLEVEVGEFCSRGGDEDDDVEFRMESVDGDWPKEGLVVEGVEMRPS